MISIAEYFSTEGPDAHRTGAVPRYRDGLSYVHRQLDFRQQGVHVALAVRLVHDDGTFIVGMDPEIRVGTKSRGPNSEPLNQFTVVVVDCNSVEFAISGIGRE
ncbi:MAG: hypothetical protein ACLQO1_06155 [Steroidobacteraceae bacterium]